MAKDDEMISSVPAYGIYQHEKHMKGIDRLLPEAKATHIKWKNLFRLKH